MKLVRVVLLLWLLIFGAASFAQTDSCQLRISLLTCSPGAELYSTFGHTALRVTDHATGMDLVFNYGTFDDSDAYTFYMNFTKGLMRYALSAYPFSDFMYEYTQEGRGITEQVLQLSCDEKNKLFTALRINVQDQHRFYYYYFHKDNCTTRAKDMIQKNTAPPVVFKNILPPTHPTYRNLLYEYLDQGHQPWSKFGIDILLGSNLDKRVTNDEAMFLPDYLLKGADSALVGSTPLVSNKSIILHAPAQPDHGGSWFTPFVLFAALFVLIALLTVLKPKGSARFLRVFDISFFLILGLVGVLLLVLWIVRVDDVCRNNWNLLWALPTHLPVAFVVARQKKWLPLYFRFVGAISILLLCTWWFLPQQINTAIVPVLGLILVRSLYLAKGKKA